MENELKQRQVANCERCENSGILNAESVYNKTASFSFRCCSHSDFWSEKKQQWVRLALPDWDPAKEYLYILSHEMNDPKNADKVLKRNNPLEISKLEHAFSKRDWMDPVLRLYVSIWGRDKVWALLKQYEANQIKTPIK